MQEVLEFFQENHKQYKVIDLHNRIMILTININIINHNNHNKAVPMYTSMDLMKVLEYLQDRAFTLIVKSLRLIINMPNHVGHELAINHYHSKYKAQYFQVIVNLLVLQFQMLLEVKLVDMNAVLVQVMLMIKLQLIYK
jgi:hypothetical protein